MNIIGKLEITPGPLELDGDFIKNKNGEKVLLVDYWYGKDNDHRCICAAPEMLKRDIKFKQFLDDMKQRIRDGLVCNPLVVCGQIANAFDFTIDEKATGKSWEEIRELLK